MEIKIFEKLNWSDIVFSAYLKIHFFHISMILAKIWWLFLTFVIYSQYLKKGEIIGGGQLEGQYSKTKDMGRQIPVPPPLLLRWTPRVFQL